MERLIDSKDVHIRPLKSCVLGLVRKRGGQYPAHFVSELCARERNREVNLVEIGRKKVSAGQNPQRKPFGHISPNPLEYGPPVRHQCNFATKPPGLHATQIQSRETL